MLFSGAKGTSIVKVRGSGLIIDTIASDAHLIADALGAKVDNLSGTTMVVTGSGGFLCSYLCDVMAVIGTDRLREPIKVVAVDNYLRGVPERLAHLQDNPNFRLITHDVTKPFDLDERVDWIIHGASVASPTYYREFPIETIDVNVNGTRQMLELARRARSMVFLSSSEIYGDPDPAFIPTPETYRGSVSCTGPRACYDESKRLGETLSVAYHEKYGVPVKSVRPFNVYGPGQRLDDKRIVPDLLSAALNREPIVLFSDGSATRSFCYASDFITGMLLTLLSDMDGEAFNVGNDEEVSIADAAHAMAEIAGDPPLSVEFRTSADSKYLTDNPRRRCPDLTKIRKLEFEPHVPMREGFRRTFESYRSLPTRAASTIGA
jgi:dTDP-glucose 4,6-dehydratase/UDP-glucuronate decarboxylase